MPHSAHRFAFSMVAALALSLAGCANVLSVTDRLMTESAASSDPRLGMDPRARREEARISRPDVGFGRKRVMGKTESELVADDRTICETNVDKLERTKPGDRVWCRWAAPKGDPPMPGSGSFSRYRNE